MNKQYHEEFLLEALQDTCGCCDYSVENISGMMSPYYSNRHHIDAHGQFVDSSTTEGCLFTFECVRKEEEEQKEEPIKKIKWNFVYEKN